MARRLIPLVLTLLAISALSGQAGAQEISLFFGQEWEEVVGLDFADGVFLVADNYLGTDGLRSRVHFIDPETGVELGVINTPVTTRVNARDIVVVGNSIFQPEDGRNLIHRYSKFDGTLLESFGHDGGFPWGIASDQSHLYILETGHPQQIQKREIASPNYPFVARFPWPSPRQSGLTFVEGHLYRILTNTGTDPVQRLDPNTGAVLETIPLPPSLESQLELDVAVVRDLAFDGSHFWFHLRLTPGPDKLVRAPSGWGGLCSYGPVATPLTFTRQRGKPVAESVEWDSCGGAGTVDLLGDRVSSATVYLNGNLLVGPSLFKGRSLPITVPVVLEQGLNTLQVEILGVLGSSLTISFTED